MNHQDILRQLLEAFNLEAEERIASMYANLTDLEKCRDSANRGKMLEIVYREAHSLKGAARSVNLQGVEAVCQEMESIFSLLKKEAMSFTPDLFDLLHQAVGGIEQFITTPEAQRPAMENSLNRLGESLAAFLMRKGAAPTLTAAPALTPAPPPEPSPSPAPGPAPSPPPPPATPTPHAEPETAADATPPPPSGKPALSPRFSDTVRISASKLDALLLKAEELITVKQTLNQHLGQVKDTLGTLVAWKKISTKARKEIQGLRGIVREHPSVDRFFQLSDINHVQIVETHARMHDLCKTMETSSRMLGLMVDELLAEMKKTSLLPFSDLFSMFPRMVRDLSRDMGKEIELEIRGGEVEIDKRILEGLKDPLIHLIRNAVDHGVESPEARIRGGKSPWGVIRLSVVQPKNNRVVMEISDDGGGIPVDLVRKRAVDCGVISPQMADKLTDAEALSLIWHSGLSTSPIITEISGRGLGMAIVQERVENLNGAITVTSLPGRGTVFKLELPVSLATFRGIIVTAASQEYVAPIANVEQTLRVRPNDIKTAGNKTIIFINRQAVSLVNLGDILGLPLAQNPVFQGGRPERLSMPAIVLSSGKRRIACLIDSIGGEQEVLVKSLGKQLRRVPNIAGATILGNGQVAPVLNVADLINAAAGRSIPRDMAEAMDHLQHQVQKSVLIVEDSFTSRTLIKNILEASGYLTATAIDGEDGYNRILEQPFDAVISDVEMPRMNGFELTAKIRAMENRSHTPVVLVTSLDSREDKERGIDVGADAYIVKGAFDQSNLLEVLERLI